MDFKRADLKLYGKTIIDVFGRVWFFIEATRESSKQNIWCHIPFHEPLHILPSTKWSISHILHYLHMWCVCNRNRGVFCCKVAYLWATSHQPFYYWFENKTK